MFTFFYLFTIWTTEPEVNWDFDSRANYLKRPDLTTNSTDRKSCGPEITSNWTISPLL